MRHLGLAFWMVCLVACVHGTDPTSDAAIDGATADRTETSVPADVGTDVVVATDTALDAPIAADAGTDAGSALGFPIVDPPAGYDGLATSPALRVENATARTVSNLSITSDSGDCLVVTGGSDIVLEHLSIGPCAGNGIYLTGNVQRVTIRDVYVHDAVGAGVSGYEAHGVTITDSHFARVSSGAYFDRCDAIRFERNSVLDVRGPFPRGQVIQFNNVRSAGNAVRCNVGENRAGESNPEDAINMFESAGTASDPILIEGNRILGGGPSM